VRQKGPSPELCFPVRLGTDLTRAQPRKQQEGMALVYVVALFLQTNRQLGWAYGGHEDTFVSFWPTFSHG
jgi:hypothetical protein